MLRSTHTLIRALLVGGMLIALGCGSRQVAGTDMGVLVTYQNIPVMPTAIYHLLAGRGLAPVVAHVENRSDRPILVRASAHLPEFGHPAEREGMLAPGQTLDIPLVPPMRPKKVRELKSRRSGVELRLRVERIEPDGRVVTVSKQTRAVSLLAHDTFIAELPAAHGGAPQNLVDLLAAWVTPEDDAVEGLVTAAQKRMEGRLAASGSRGRYRSGSGRVDPSREADERRAMVRSLYEVLRANGFSYADSADAALPYPLKGHFQRVRLPQRSLEVTAYNCIDGVVLFASALEYLGYEPIMVILPGHAVVGWREQAGTARYDVLDTTVVEKQPFDQAVQLARRQVGEKIRHGQFSGQKIRTGRYRGEAVHVIDVGVQRASGVVPAGGADLRRHIRVEPFDNKTPGSGMDWLSEVAAQRLASMCDASPERFACHLHGSSDSDVRADLRLTGRYVLQGDELTLLASLTVVGGETLPGMQVQFVGERGKARELLEEMLAQYKRRLGEYGHREWVSTAPNAVADEALEAYRRGRLAYRRYTLSGLREARAEFERAIALQGDFADAHAALSETYERLALWELLLDRDPLPLNEKALASAEEALSHARGSGHARRAHAWALTNFLRGREAFEEIASALRIDPEDAESHYVRSILASSYEGGAEQARPHLEKAVQLDPEFVPATLDLAQLLAERGEVDQAIEMTRRIVETIPDADLAQYYLGDFLALNVDAEGALKAYRAVAERIPGFGLAHHQICLWLWHLEGAGPSAEACRRGAELYLRGWRFDTYSDSETTYQTRLAQVRHRPDNVPAWLDIGGYRLAKGDPDGAIAAFIAAREKISAVSEGIYAGLIDFGLGVSYCRKKECDVGILHLARAVEAHPRWYGARYQYARVLGERGRHAQAVSQCTRVLREAGGYDAVMCHYVIGRAHEAEGQPKLARKSYLAALDLAYDFATLHDRLIEMDHAAGRHDEVRERIEDRVESARTCTNIVVLARQYRQFLDEPERAAALLDDKSDLCRNTADYLQLATAYRELGKLEQAEHQLQNAETVAGAARHYIDLMNRLLELERPEDARRLLPRARSLGKTRDEQMKLARILRTLGDAAAAYEEINEACQTATVGAWDHCKCADAYKEADRRAAALASLAKARETARSTTDRLAAARRTIQWDPKHVHEALRLAREAHADAARYEDFHTIGDVFVRAGEDDAAADAFDQASAHTQKSSLHRHLAEHFKSLGRPERAMQEAARAERTAKEYEDWHQLGHLLINLGDRRRAASAFDKALEQAAQVSQFRQLAWHLRDLGERKRALGALRAAERHVESAEGWAALGSYYIELESTRDAKGVLTEGRKASKSAKDLLSVALVYASNAMVAEALPLVEKARKQARTFEDVFATAAVMWGAGQREDVPALFDAAARVARTAEQWNALAESSIAIGDPARAVRACRQIEDTSGFGGKVALETAKLYEKLDRADDAARVLRALASADGGAETRLEAISQLLTLGWTDDAREQLDRLLEGPLTFSELLSAADALMLMVKLPDALKVLQRAAGSAHSFRQHTLIADRAVILPSVPEAHDLARAQLAEAMPLARGAESWAHVANLYKLLGDRGAVDDAIDHAAAAVRTPDDALRLAEALFGIGEDDRAIASLSPYLVPTSEYRVLHDAGKLLQNEEHATGALNAFKLASDRADVVEQHLDLALVHFRGLEESALALNEVKRAEGKADSFRSWMAIGLGYRQFERLDDALRAFQMAHASGQTADSRLWEAYTHQSLGDAQAAREDLETAAGMARTFKEHIEAATLFGSLKEWARQCHHIEKAAQVSEGALKELETLVDAARICGVAAIRPAVPITDPGVQVPLFVERLQAEIALIDGRVEHARRRLESVTRRDPGGEEGLYARASLMRATHPDVFREAWGMTLRRALFSGPLRPGDVVLQVDGRPIRHFHDYVAAAKEVGSKPVTFVFVRDGEKRESTLRRLPLIIEP